MARNGEMAVAREANFKIKPLLVVPVKKVTQLRLTLECDSSLFVKWPTSQKYKKHLLCGLK